MIFEVKDAWASTATIWYNGIKYGDWNDEGESPEDLHLLRDLQDLITIGIDIGKQITEDMDKLYCIELRRELEELAVLHARFDHVPTEKEIIEYVRSEDFIFKNGYDEVDFYEITI